ncbi:putative methyltransferase DDB_G0268948 [Centruroides sculpturatus]|uniref:putative methyltransferase DDB_G0268948 n=1 Tax=Centruroides sculpturatus TaxID=218467 RepID=UPI000C6DB16D|nr:putative methyltransferase DDB_G0268948 [Centruroides sculpturatus]
MAERGFERLEQASAYAKFRPSPPQFITDKILKYLEEKINPPYEHVLDVGCGTGQSSIVWKPYFRNITGCDISSAQIEEARKKSSFENVNFIICPSEKIPFPDNSVQMISVVTALHWFDIEEFFKEAKRLLIRNGVLAVQNYHTVRVKFDTDEKTSLGNAILKELMYDKLHEYMSKNVINSVNEFSSINFPFCDVVRHTGIKDSIEVTVDYVIGFFFSFSRYQTFKERQPEKAESVLKQLQERLLELAGGENGKFRLERNCYLILCRNV